MLPKPCAKLHRLLVPMSGEGRVPAARAGFVSQRRWRWLMREQHYFPTRLSVVSAWRIRKTFILEDSVGVPLERGVATPFWDCVLSQPRYTVTCKIRLT